MADRPPPAACSPQDNVFKVCDQPHPLLVAQIIQHCAAGRIEDAYAGLMSLCDVGYSPLDIISTLFRVARNADGIQEFLKLEFLKEIGFCHMRISDGINSRLQLSGLLAKMCKLTRQAAA